MAAAATASFTKEVLPPTLDSTSEPPELFDGTTRLYISYICPYAQRTWIARNYKARRVVNDKFYSICTLGEQGLQEKIKLVPIDLDNRPAWYKEKVYPANKVPSLEHNNEVKGESLDLIKYINKYFEGPELLPDDPAKQQFAEELLSYSDSFNKVMYTAMISKGDVGDDFGAALDKLEDALLKFDDGPFFLGHFSLVDIAYAPFIERLQTFLKEVKNYDITEGRPKLILWIEELGKIDAYTHTKQDPQVLLARNKKRLGVLISPVTCSSMFI
ncbi:hypothetical protein C4D60_Mb08t21380 [Musa balbisiana]|uniref:GST N-terminal domain-containing protein n=1 Tax=Musa balbisiana TaxID=52838 RepID=A0A4S8K5I7_MUSBA|nr:hypothetical protein C4D60_Mb08t21380 [Musa balbisiana]